MPLYIMQNSFTGGEFSPVMDARQDVQKYNTGVKTMKNFYVKPHGAAVNRPGTYFIAATKDSSKKSRLIPFVFSEETAYVIEFGEGYCRFYRDGGQVTSNGSPVEVITPYTAADLPSLKFTQSADVLYLVHPNYSPKTLSRLSDTSWVLADFPYKLGPFAPMNLNDTTITPSGTTGTISLTASSSVFNSNHVGALFKLEQDVEAQVVSASLTNGTGTATTDTIYSGSSTTLTITVSGTWTGSIGTWNGISVIVQQSSDNSTWTDYNTYTDNGTYTLPGAASTYYRVYVSGVASGSCVVSLGNGTSTVSKTCTANNVTDTIRGMGTWLVTTHGTWTGKIYVEKSEDNGATWKKLRTYSSNGEYNIDASGTEDVQIVLMRVRMYDYTSGTCNIDLQFEPYTSIGVVKITAITSDTAATGTVTKELGSTDATKYWYEGAWSNNRGWPSAVVFFQNRLVFANTKAEPQTLWSSKTGDYVNFGISSPVVDSDAITTPLVSDQVNAIHSLKAMGKIIGFTGGGYWVIGPGSDGGTFTPSSQNASNQGCYRASTIDPIIIGTRILFSRTLGSSVRDIGYDISQESYAGNDLTIYAEHLFRSRSVSEWAYQQEPEGIVWCVCSDDALLGLTYLKEQEVLGWHRHETDGTFESVCTIPGSDRDEVWFIVNRTVNGQTVRYVEQMAARQTAATYSTNDDGEYVVVYDPADQYFVDCGLTYSSTTTVQTFSDLGHLEGKTVSILADGNVHDQLTVTNGAVTLNYKASKVHIGLPYTCDLETLNIDFPGKDGTIQTRFKKITKATLRLEHSRGAFIGLNFKKMYELKMRSTEPYDTPIALQTVDKDMTLNGASNKYGRVCVRVSDPLPITILAIVTEVTMDD